MKKYFVFLIVFLAAACSSENSEPSRFKMSKGEALGLGLGAVAGSAIGYQFGSGLAQSLITAGSFIVGGGGGYLAASKLSPSDQASYTQAAMKALSSAADGQALNWSNPKTRTSGVFRPTRTFRIASGDWCREYRAAIAIKTEVLIGGGAACRIGGGEWMAFGDNAPG